MKKIIYLLSVSVLLSVTLFGQSTQELQKLLQAQAYNPISQKFIVVNASDTSIFCAKFKSHISFIEPFDEVRIGCSSLSQGHNQLCYAIVESSLSLVSEESLIYETPFFEINNHDTVGVSHLFYVKISSKADTVSLKSFAQEQNVEILGFNQHMPLWYTLSCTKYSKGNALEMAIVFRSSGLFEHSEPDLLAGGRLNNPNDQYFPYQWGLLNVGQNNGIPNMDINVLRAQTITTGNSNICVAVIDQGFELDHPDLGSVSPYSYNTESGNSPSLVFGDHGTACAGIIGATVNNQIGIVGIAPNSPLMSISNMLRSSVPDENQKLANGIHCAWKHDASVISNSWRYPFDSCAFISEAIDSAVVFGRDSKGCILVFAAGNNNDTVNYPACLDEVIAVGAVDRCGARSGIIDSVPESCEPWSPTSQPGSAFGNKLDVVAPGTHIYTTDRQESEGYNQQKGVAGNYYDNFYGTSAACPHVAGVAALMLSVNPNLTSQEVRVIIEQTARKIRRDLYSYTDTFGHPNGEWNIYMGYGLLDAHRAVLKAAYHKVYGDIALTLCDTNRHAYTVRAPHNANIDSVSFFWTCSDNLQMVAGQNTDSVWVKRTHSGIGQLQCHIVHAGDTVTSTLDIPVASNRPVYDNVSLSGGFSFPDTFVLSREIVIDSLAGLAWQNKTVLCTPDCRIIVRPGGFMTLDHTILTSACPNEMWQGIEVLGNSAMPQILHNNGTLYIENGSVIENAYTAVRNCLATDNAYTTTGGNVQAFSSTFRNNCRSVKFDSYGYTSQPGLMPDYKSMFRQCTFVVNDQNLFAANDTVFTEHVKLWEVKGVQFKGCSFHDSTSTPVSGRRGIYAEDAGLTIDTYCDFAYSGCECPESQSTYSLFSGFTTAVEVNTTGFQYPVVVNQVRFSNNGTGVKINANNYAIVTRCTFNLDQWPVFSGGSIGLLLDHCSGYKVEADTFKRTTYPSGGLPIDNSVGILVVSSGNTYNSLYKNDFFNLTKAISVDGGNRNLQIACDSFYHNKYDIYISTLGAIASSQGSLTQGADNNFDGTQISSIYNLGGMSLTYYHSPGAHHSPYSPLNVTVKSKAIPCNCASTLCGNNNGGMTKSLADFQSDMDADSYYDAVRAIMSDSLLDLYALEQWHTAAQPIADPYSLTETRFCEGCSETFSAAADDAELSNYAEFHALKLALRNNDDAVGANNYSPLQPDGHVNWYALTPAQIAQLQVIAERNTGRASVMAKGVLCFFFGICYEDDPVGLPQCDSPTTDNDTTDAHTKRAVTDIADDAALTVYPNPTDDLLYIELSGAGIASVALYDLQGRTIYSQNPSNSPTEHSPTATMNMQNVPAGVYVLHVTDTNGKEYRQKIVKK